MKCERIKETDGKEDNDESKPMFLNAKIITLVERCCCSKSPQR